MSGPEGIIHNFGRTDPKLYGRIKVFTLGDEEAKLDRPYLLKGIIYKGDLIFITGDPGSGKTTLAQYIALAIAQGRSIFGRQVRKGRVLYLAFEGKDLFLLKMSVFEKRFGRSREIVYATQSMRLLENAPSGEDADILLQIIKDERIDLVIFDTWSKMLAGADENAHQVVSGMISVLDRVRQVTGAAVVVNAHPNRTKKGDVSGSFTVVKDTDALLAIEVKGGVRSVKAVKLRFGQIGYLFSFRLSRVVIGQDTDGDEITSVDIEEVVDKPFNAPLSAARMLSPGDKEALKWLREATSEYGKLGGHGAPRRALAVTVDNWQTVAKKRAAFKSDEARRKQVERALTALVAARMIQAEGDAIWIPK
jgi:archaellum biogenesis ATPase FlaH